MTALRIDGTLFRVAETSALRRAAAEMLARAVEAVDAYAATARAIALTDTGVRIGGRTYPLRGHAKVIVVGAGKASASMARAAEDALGPRLTAGLVTTAHGHRDGPPRIAVREAAHPVPDAAGEAAAREMLSLVRGLGPDDLVLCLLSGGGSALLPLPRAGLSLADMADTTNLLLRSGADIVEMNMVRRHLSAIAGGQLARAAAPARVATLAISDVVGSPPEAMASGPTVPDPSTFADALAVLDRYGIAAHVPAAARGVLERGCLGAIPDTPKPGDAAFPDGAMTVIADNLTAARAAAEAARAAGFHTLLLTTYLEGEARHAGRVLAGIARQIASTGEPAARPACVVCGGETTVTVTGNGRGGRNQELALAGAAALEDLRDALLVGFATDGRDGPTDAAGAAVDGTTVARARRAGLDPARHLRDNNAYPLLDAIGDLIRTGPTGTNVADLVLILCGPTHR
ncbi:MAG TPA: glycerate kinase [bacterium]|nr:glycerate kinase [bacterium]